MQNGTKREEFFSFKGRPSSKFSNVRKGIGIIANNFTTVWDKETKVRIKYPKAIMRVTEHGLSSVAEMPPFLF